jgi:hypothetical protein
MMPETVVIVSAVTAVLGIVLGEIFDVWYDLTHAEALVESGGIMETVQFAPKRPLAFGYAKLYFREVLVTPDAFEHYHWGIWLATNAISMFSLVPPFASLMLGLSVSLILDENRRGLADQPFGVGKPYFATCSFLGVMLSALLVLRMLTISTTFELEVSVVAFCAPFIVLAWFWIARLVSR